MIHSLCLETPNPPASYHDKEVGRYNTDRLETWRSEVRFAHQQAGRWILPEGVPLYAVVTVWVRRPASHLCKDGTLKPSAPTYHLQTPDGENLGKPVLDALTEIAWADDCVFAETTYRKYWSQDRITSLVLKVSIDPLIAADCTCKPSGQGEDNK